MRRALFLLRGNGNKERKQVSEAFAVRTILVPTDFSQCSLAGTEYAAFLARKLGATLRLFHAIYPYTNYVFVDRAGVRLSGLAEAVEETARQEMDALKQMDFLRGLPVKTEILPGPAVDEICAAAGEPEVDLIVTSTHGRTGFEARAHRQRRRTRRSLRGAPGLGCP